MKILKVEDIIEDFRATEGDATPWSVREIIDYIQNSPDLMNGCTDCIYCTKFRDKRLFCEKQMWIVTEGDYCSKWEKESR